MSFEPSHRRLELLQSQCVLVEPHPWSYHLSEFHSHLCTAHLRIRPSSITSVFLYFRFCEKRVESVTSIDDTT